MRRLDEAAPPAVRPARGVHIVVARALLPGAAGALLPVPDAARFIFTVPWGAVTLIGTTDSDHRGALDDPEPAEREIDQLLAEANASLGVPLTRADVIAAYAGLRPLVADNSAHTADLSRRHRVTSSESGVVTIFGGKLTTWRRMAEDTVDRLGDAVLGPLPPCRTTTLTLDGASRAREVQELAREEALDDAAARRPPVPRRRRRVRRAVGDGGDRRGRARAPHARHDRGSAPRGSRSTSRRRAPGGRCLTASARRTRSKRFRRPRSPSLRALLGDRLLLDEQARRERAADWWPLAKVWATAGDVASLPAAVALPESEAEVRAILATCTEERVPVTPSAGRSSVCGQSVPVAGGLVLDLARMRPAAQAEQHAAYGFDSFTDGLDSVRRVLRRGARPAVVRLYDAEESGRVFDAEQCVLIVLAEGEPDEIAWELRVVAEECAHELDASLVARWLEHRNDVTALDHAVAAGLVVDTIETVALWRDVARVYADVRAAVAAVPGTLAVTAHCSHAYTSGACLYFTFAVLHVRWRAGARRRGCLLRSSSGRRRWLREPPSRITTASVSCVRAATATTSRRRAQPCSRA